MKAESSRELVKEEQAPDWLQSVWTGIKRPCPLSLMLANEKLGPVGNLDELPGVDW